MTVRNDSDEAELSKLSNKKRVRALAALGVAVLGAGCLGPLVGLQPTWRGVAIGFTLAMIASFVRGWAALYQRPFDKVALITAGPFSVMRHPRYFGTVLLTFGGGLILDGSWRPWPLAFTVGLALVVLVIHLFKARREERDLLKKLTPGYARYRQRVGPFWPKSLPVGPFKPATASWKFWRDRVLACPGAALGLSLISLYWITGIMLLLVPLVPLSVFLYPGKKAEMSQSEPEPTAE